MISVLRKIWVVLKVVCASFLIIPLVCLGIKVLIEKKPPTGSFHFICIYYYLFSIMFFAFSIAISRFSGFLPPAVAKNG